MLVEPHRLEKRYKTEWLKTIISALTPLLIGNTKKILLKLSQAMPQGHCGTGSILKRP
jgi:hypothetical protein